MFGLGGLGRRGTPAIACALTLLGLAAGPARAADGALDGRFGSGGLALLPADRVESRGAPLVDSAGRTYVAGMSTANGGRAFLARLTPAGALDGSFGTAGYANTTFTPASQALATALDPATGRTLVAGGSGGGKVLVRRFKADGTADAGIDIPFGTSADVPTSLDVLPDGKVLLGVAPAGGNGGKMLVAKIDLAAGRLDPSFSGDGIAEITIPGKAARTVDVEPLAGGSVLVVGSVGGVDVGLARLTSAGALDLGFGSAGTATVDVGGAERPVAVTTTNTGAFTVAGVLGTSGFVARFTSTGALDGSFGTGGRLTSGLAPSGAYGLSPAALTTDSAGRVLLAGATQPAAAGGSQSWAVRRLAPTGASPIDPGFGSGGVATAPACDGAGATPSGLTAVDGRILVAGSCTGARRVAAVRLLDAPALSDVSLAVSPSAAAAGHETTRPERFPTQALTLAAADVQDGAFRSGAFRSGAFRSGAFRSGAFRSGAFRSGAFRSGAFRSGAFRSGAFRSGAFRSGGVAQAITLASLPLEDSEGARPELSWSWVLDGTTLAG